MGICFIKQLKVEVNNPNLPKFETMQQFTLDAITKSGNSTMSDKQKFALNHFFYQIGAINNNTLWGKVRSLFIPMIGVGKTTVVLDYKGENTAITYLTYVIDQAGALEISGDSGISRTLNTNLPNVTTNIKNNALLVAPSPGYLLGTTAKVDIKLGSSVLSFRQRNSEDIGGFVTDGTNTYYQLLSQVGTTCGLVNTKEDSVDVYAYKNGNLIKNDGSALGTYADVNGTVTDAAYKIALQTEFKCGLIIDFNTRLTDAECLVVLNAADALRTAFA